MAQRAAVQVGERTRTKTKCAIRRRLYCTALLIQSPVAPAGWNARVAAFESTARHLGRNTKKRFFLVKEPPKIKKGKKKKRKQKTTPLACQAAAGGGDKGAPKL